MPSMKANYDQFSFKILTINNLNLNILFQIYKLFKMKLNFTRIEVAHYLGYDRKTLYNKLQKVDLILPRGFLTLEQIHSICEKLGHPKPIPDQKRLKAPNKIL
jgi:hypothetical protein